MSILLIKLNFRLSCAALACAALYTPAQAFCAEAGLTAAETSLPGFFWTLPFALLLLAIAFFPLSSLTKYWWEHNRNKLLCALVLCAWVLIYYCARGYGFSHDGHITAPGLTTALSVLKVSLLEYIPFIVLLSALYIIAGGISLRGDLSARPLTNTVFLALGALLASFIGTTGASMLLIYPLLKTNSERKFTTHTFCFFIMLVSNIGGCLTPLGDPPLFLGYLKGVPFSWTFTALWPQWLAMTSALLIFYYALDSLAYRRENPEDLARDNVQIEPLTLRGSINFAWLCGVIAATALIMPGRTFTGTSWVVPLFAREIVLGVLTIGSLITTPAGVRKENSFSYGPILEVACLFLGIFVVMQVPVEILRLSGAHLGLTQPLQFFWTTGLLSSFLDNAPTYVVFFETAGSLPSSDATMLHGVNTATGTISEPLLQAISLGAVFMGANTYIGNGPNFMVKSIVEANGVKMPSFFGYMLRWSMPVLLPLFAVLSWVNFR